MRLLSEPSTSSSIPHGHVFKVRIRSQEHALKVVSRLSLEGFAHSAQFNFFDLGKIGPFYPGREHLLDKIMYAIISIFSLLNVARLANQSRKARMIFWQSAVMGMCWILGIRVIRLKMGGCSQKCLVGALTID